MIKKTFEYKGQMINYFNKIKNNPNIDKIWCGWFTATKAYTIYYTYKK